MIRDRLAQSIGLQAGANILRRIGGSGGRVL
jgi:hypothetical protein